MDVDKWDYFARDCHYLGITNEFNWRYVNTTIMTSEGHFILFITYIQSLLFRWKEIRSYVGYVANFIGLAIRHCVV